MSSDPTGRRPIDSPLRAQDLVLAVHAPFGTDEALSTFPDGQLHSPLDHPLSRYLAEVARSGVEVVALLDLQSSGTWFVHVPAGRPADSTAASLGRLDMADPESLTHLLSLAREAAPRRAVILTLEGHGAGFLPDLDKTAFTFDNFTGGGAVQWRLGGLPGASQGSAPFDDQGKPLVGEGAPVLPIGGPTLPTNHAAISTYGLGHALSSARQLEGVEIPVLHLNNCFNMSVELLHTVSPYAEYATGYCNYNFFTAGEAYPAVFARLAKAGAATSEELARWFAEENHRVLLENGHEPTVGCSVALSRMRDIVERVDDLSDALLAALRTASPSERPVTVAKIQKAIEHAQQYDSRSDFVLEVPDELTDLDSLATELMQQEFGPFKVHAAADALRVALSGIKVYGDKGTPWMSPGSVWNFHAKNLAMNIFLPDPMRKGLWDWRSQYYLDVNPDPQKAAVQPHIIDFVKITDWVDFLIEYHRDTAFVGLLPAAIPEFPVKSLRGERPPCTHGHGRDRDRQGENDHDADDKGRGASKA
jgi:hypothetical protein